jgi:hypothetical protein
MARTKAPPADTGLLMRRVAVFLRPRDREEVEARITAGSPERIQEIADLIGAALEPRPSTGKPGKSKPYRFR